MIIVIHEFGFPHQGIKEIVKIGKERNIPVVEDVAHSLDSYLDQKKAGEFGDYTIFSLPKIFPLKFLIVKKQQL